MIRSTSHRPRKQRQGTVKAPLLFVLLTVCPHLMAQTPTEPIRKFSIDIIAGPLEPKGSTASLRERGSGSAPGNLVFGGTTTLGFSLGYRPIRFFQLDAGFAAGGGTAFGGGEITVHEVNNPSGPSRTIKIGSVTTLTSIGSRFILPALKDRLLLSVGGGGLYLSESETGLDNVVDYGPNSRGGFAPYLMTQIIVFVGKSKRVGLGLTARYLKGLNSNLYVPSNAGVFNPDNEQYVQLGGTIGFRF